MAAFRRAVELGAAFIETDLHITRDARFVAIHDDTLERTTNGHRRVSEYSLAELRELDAGSWFGAEFAGEHLPTLSEILEFGRDADIVFYLEIKYEVAWTMHPALIGALRDSGEAARVVVLCFDAPTLESLRRMDPTLMTGLLLDQPLPDPVRAAERCGARQLCPRGDLVTPELVLAAHRADLPVVAWTINNGEEMSALLSAGVNGIMTDFPDRLRSVIESSARAPR